LWPPCLSAEFDELVTIGDAADLIISLKAEAAKA
jgi:hypothetical protein